MTIEVMRVIECLGDGRIERVFEGDIGIDEVRALLDAKNGERFNDDESPGDEVAERLEGHSRRAVDMDAESCDVPASSIAPDRDGLTQRAEELSELSELARNRGELSELARNRGEKLNSILGAVRLLAGVLASGVKITTWSNIPKLLKQMMARATEMRDEQAAVDGETSNLLRALSRLGIHQFSADTYDDVGAGSKRLQLIAHDLDILKRDGIRLTTPVDAYVDDSPFSPNSVHRGDKLSEIGRLQKRISGQMLDLATEDGFVTEGMDAVESRARVLEWSAAMDRNARQVREIERLAAMDGVVPEPPDASDS